jgi:L-histidine N-alpha-methyltransferase
MTIAATSVVQAGPDTDTFLREVSEALAGTPRSLPCKYLYDARGSELFEEICQLEEYYPTRTELGIFERDLRRIAAAIGPRALIIEYGCGASVKTRQLLSALEDPVGIVAVDISAPALRDAAVRLRAEFPTLEVSAVVADFTDAAGVPLPAVAANKRVVFFPGSTIGNFTRPHARDFLSRQAELLGAGGGLLVGVDLKKDPRVLEAAYDDRRGVTAAFNLNILAHINRELGADFDLDAFEHRAVYREPPGRIEMWLVATHDQRVRVGGQMFAIAAGEGICTEHSAKYSITEFRGMAWSAGFALDRVWTDPREWFSVHYGEVRARR